MKRKPRHSFEKELTADELIMKKVQSMGPVAESSGYRRCNHCLKIKPISMFFRDKHYAEGLQAKCKACEKFARKHRLIRLRARKDATLKCTRCNDSIEKHGRYINASIPKTVRMMCRPCHNEEVYYSILVRKGRIRAHGLSPHNHRLLTLQRREAIKHGLFCCVLCLKVLPVDAFMENRNDVSSIREYCDDCKPKRDVVVDTVAEPKIKKLCRICGSKFKTNINARMCLSCARRIVRSVGIEKELKGCHDPTAEV